MKFDLERVPENEYGQFYSGDAYVCLKTKEDETFDIHYWLGKDATVDEMGTAAIKAVEMDQALAGVPVQHREVQNHESALFLSYFPSGIRYLKGGYDSGFHHVEDNLDNFQPRLYHCKGKRNIRCSEVECTKESLNLGDVFILDLGREIYVWMPPESGRLERIKGMDSARHIAHVERHWKSHVNVLDSDWDQEETFWSYFGGVDAVGEIASAKNDDEEYWMRTSVDVGLYRVSDASGRLEITRVDDVKRSELDTNDAFILDAGNCGIYIWIGRRCNMNERGKAIMWGEDYIKRRNLPKWTQVTSVMEGSEPPYFTQWFVDWDKVTGAANTKSFEPRLFQVSDKSGRLVVEEIANFDQEKYLQQSALPRQNATIETINQGEETSQFKHYFRNWDDELFESGRRSVANLRKLFFES
ncbi:gelsolin repeat protein [Oesophagostomum dentatum]|uniref:Gelsolin repeat protein n=1 Tax=Oesophagostomum dentatum TaxID=61180 RepID=A0A0B1TNQ7_OESDE|nr:gelsolin repeat protein [Oesophagostomum dentatum]